VVFRRRQRPVGEDAYLGERVTVTGRLMVSGDLDIGDDVTIEEGFEANGWIVIRNPVPTLVFYFIVLSQLLRLGETDAADNLAEALADGEDVRDPCWSRVAPRFPTTRGAFRRPRASATTVGSTATSARSRSASASATRCSAPCAPERGSQSARTRRSTATSLLAAEPSRSKPAPACSATSPPAILVVHDGAEIDGTLRARGEMKLVQETGDGDEGEGETESDDAGEDEGDADEIGETDADELSDEDGTSDGDDSADGEESDSDESGVEESDSGGSDVESPDTEEPDVDAEAT